MKYISWLVVLMAILPLSALSLNVQASELYRWLDSRGVMHYSDTPPPKSEQAEIKKFYNSTGADDSLPYETRRAKQNFPVTLYVGPGCGYSCEESSRLLSKRGIPFTEKVLNTREAVDAFRLLSGIEGVPALAVGKTYLRGLVPDQWHRELDIAGYPKIAPYGSKQATPAATSAEPAVNPAQ